MMMITVEHSTAYRYDCAVNLQPHIFRLRPRTTTTQRLLSFHLGVLPEPAGATECLDQDDNLALYAWFGAPVAELIVTSRFRVELLRGNPFDFNLFAESEHLPMRYPYPLSAALSPYSNALNVHESVKQFARTIAGAGEQNVPPAGTSPSCSVTSVAPWASPPDSSADMNELRRGSLRQKCTRGRRRRFRRPA